MTLTEARSWVRQFARNAAGDNTIYSSEMIDRAVQALGDNFIRHTKCTRTVSTLTLVDGDADLPAFPTGFRPERFLRAWIAAEGRVELTDPGSLLDMQIADPTGEGVPSFLAFTGTTTGELWPLPDDGYSLKVAWWEPLTSFTAGTASPDSVTLNIPDDMLREAIVYGATAFLQHNDVEHDFAGPSWRKYLEYRRDMATANTLGARSSARDMIQES